MAIWWLFTIGFVICLGLVGGIFVHFLMEALDMEDATRVDPIDPNNP